MVLSTLDPIRKISGRVQQLPHIIKRFVQAGKRDKAGRNQKITRKVGKKTKSYQTPLPNIGTGVNQAMIDLRAHNQKQ